MTVYCGVDFHARKQTISYLTTEDGEVQQTELHHEQDNIRGFYAKLRSQSPVIVGFETSGYAAWFEEMLEELGCEIWIGMPAAIRRQARRRQKNDRRDADLILELMLRGDFPRLHRYTPASREVLQQLRYRHRLVKLRTIVVNSLQYMALSRGVSLRTKLLTGRGQERMKQLSLPDHLAKQRDEMCELLQELTQKIETAERWLDLKAKQDAQVERFANPRKVTAYVGFDPVEDSSGERQRIGAISKQGSRLLRFLLVEAGQVAVRTDPDLKAAYWRVQLRRNHQKAKVAVARRLLVRAFIMLRDEIDYAEFQRRGVAARSTRRTA